MTNERNIQAIRRRDNMGDLVHRFAETALSLSTTYERGGPIIFVPTAETVAHHLRVSARHIYREKEFVPTIQEATGLVVVHRGVVLGEPEKTQELENTPELQVSASDKIDALAEGLSPQELTNTIGRLLIRLEDVKPKP